MGRRGCVGRLGSVCDGGEALDIVFAAQDEETRGAQGRAACGDTVLGTEIGARDRDEVKRRLRMLAVVTLDRLLQPGERFEILVAL